MDSARRMHSDTAGREPDMPLMRADEFAKILRLRPQGGDRSPPSSRERGPSVTAQDIASALDLVRDAAASIRQADERVRDSETRTQALLHRAAEELKSAEARAEAAEALALAAEARAREAQARAEEAENWLRQIFATIAEELPGRR